MCLARRSANKHAVDQLHLQHAIGCCVGFGWDYIDNLHGCMLYHSHTALYCSPLGLGRHSTIGHCHFQSTSLSKGLHHMDNRGAPQALLAACACCSLRTFVALRMHLGTHTQTIQHVGTARVMPATWSAAHERVKPPKTALHTNMRSCMQRSLHTWLCGSQHRPFILSIRWICVPVVLKFCHCVSTQSLAKRRLKDAQCY